MLFANSIHGAKRVKSEVKYEVKAYRFVIVMMNKRKSPYHHFILTNQGLKRFISFRHEHVKHMQALQINARCTYNPLSAINADDNFDLCAVCKFGAILTFLANLAKCLCKFHTRRSL